MVEYSNEWYAEKAKRDRIMKWVLIVGAALSLLVTPFFLAEVYPTIGLNEENSTLPATEISQFLKKIDEESGEPCYEIETADGDVYYISWKFYVDVMPYITVNGYEGKQFTIAVDRTGNVLAMSVEGREKPLISFEEGFDNVNSENFLLAARGLVTLALALFFIFMAIGKSRSVKKDLEAAAKA